MTDGGQPTHSHQVWFLTVHFTQVQLYKFSMHRRTAEEKLIETLRRGGRTFTELMTDTGLSSRWLALKLQTLRGAWVVQKRGRSYGLREEALPLNLLIEKLIGIARELHSNKAVIAAILVGSVAKGTYNEESDLDIVLVTSEDLPTHSLEEALEEEYHTGIDLFHFTREGFHRLLSSKGTLLFGIAEGYRFLFSKEKALKHILDFKVKHEIRSNWIIIEGAGTWLPKQMHG